MDDDKNKPATKATKGYAKRPTWQWVLIYIVAAIIVYGIIYYFFIRSNNTTGGGSLGY